MRRQVFEARSVSLATLTACLLCCCWALADERVPKDDSALSRRTILEQAGLWPLPDGRPSVSAFSDHRRDHSGYSVENVALETAPGCYSTGNLYRPLLRHDLAPAVLVVDDVEARRRYSAERQILCAQLARLGVTVLACNTIWDTAASESEPNGPISVHVWNSLRAIDYLVGLERVDVKRIGVIAPDGGRLDQIDDRIAVSVDKPGDFSPASRKAIYSLLGQHFRLTPDPFYAQTFTQPREPEPQPREDDKKIKLESRDELTTFATEREFVRSATMTNEQAAEIIASYVHQLRTTPPTNGAVLSMSDARRAEYVEKALQPADDALIVTPPGFAHAGVRKVASGPDVGRLAVVVRDHTTGNKTPCRVNVVGPDGNYYEPELNPLKEHSYTSEWPNAGWGNRALRAPVRYLGRPFYTNGECTVEVPSGAARVEVWKGFEYRPETLTTFVAAGQTRRVEMVLTKTIPAADFGYWSGDPHIHFQRRDNEDQARIFDLLECEDTHFGTVLTYNEPPGPYHGLMKHMDSPQLFGLGRRSVATRGDYSIISGQEYRSGHYGHLNLFLLDNLALDGKSLDADRWPLFGLVARAARELGGMAFYAHGGYAQEIYADVAQGDVDGVELLQHGAYRGIGLVGWYRMLNSGFRVPANGAADYPACRMLSDCKTYVYAEKRPTIEEWLRGMAAGRGFFTSGPLLLLEVDGQNPGAIIEQQDAAATRIKVRIRVRSEVAPVTNVQLVANGRIVDELKVAASLGQGSWIELEREIELVESAWIAARAFSLSPLGTPNAEAHTNPVYVYLNGKAPYDRESLDGWLAALDRQIAIHRDRKFDGQAKVLDYFDRSRDILTKIRAAGGVPSAGLPSNIATERSAIDDPTSGQHTDDSLKAYLKPVPPKPFDEFLKSFETVGGFEMQPVAREPLVYDPIAAAFDENGQLYVCEMRDYPYKPAAGKKPLGAVRLLKDVDGDGTLDESHVFAEHLLWAGGIAPWRGGVFVAAPPDIWYFKDTDGDHHADVRRQIFTGFGTQNQQAMLNNLTMGLDHKIYGSTAGNGGKIRCVELPAGGKPANCPEVDVNGRDFCFDPVTGAFEAITGTMQFGNSFDDWGNRFLCSESQPLLHAVLPQRYLVRNPYLPVPSALQNIVPGPVPIFRTSPVERWRIIRSSRRIAHGERPATSAGASHHVIDAAAGVAIYRGGAYPAEYYGNVFVSDAQNNLIHRRTLLPDGVTFKSDRADANTEFVRSPDHWFRPVNLVNAPDGTLYVLDMSREILETIHVPSDVAKFLDFTSGRQHGRIYRLAPPGFLYPGPPRLGDATADQLVSALESPHGWWRDTAHRLLFERPDSSAVAPLRRLLSGSRLPQARLHALWSLSGLKALSIDDLAKALEDKHAAVREHALRLAESRLDNSPALLDKLIAQTDDALPRIRFQAAFTLGESRNSLAAKALAKLARSSSSDPWIRTAILSSASPMAFDLLTELLFDEAFVASADGRQCITQLVFMVGARNQTAEVHQLLQQLAMRKPLAEFSSQQLLVALGRGLKQSGARLEMAGGIPKTAAAYWQDSIQTAHTTARNKTGDLEQRRQAVELLSLATFTESRETLTELLDVRQPAAVQIAAVRALADYANADVGKLLLDRWLEYAPDVRAAVTSAVLGRPERTRQFLKAALAGEISLAHLDTTQRSLLIEHPDSVVRSLATKLFADATGSRDEVIAAYSKKPDIDADGRRGEVVFRRECMTCHKIGDIGSAVGPDLTSSASRDRDALLVHVLDPNRNVLPNFENYLCIDSNGRVTTGILTAQTATSITLLRQESETSTILRANIDELTSTGKSLMPEGFERNISREEMADLVAFLQSSQVPGAATPLDIGTSPGMVEPDKSTAD
ncbi:MAG: CehA/McbA family metallohydrolase [Planctomycetes bacterium]|nr:CehA/McbA family metallohydrolase [Planctomycetota bacterium]